MTVIASPLPDREYRHLLQFYIAPKMDYGMRLMSAALLIVAGFGVQLLLPSDSPVVLLVASLPLLIAGNVLLLVRGYNLRPTQSMHTGTWEKTTTDRFDKMRELEKEVRKWDESFTDLTCTSGVIALVMLAVGTGLLGLILHQGTATRFWAPIIVADIAVLLLPHWITGTRRGWRPVALRQTVDALKQAVSTIEAFDNPPCQVQPMFEMAGNGERQVPINARAFVRFPDGPEDLLGMQFQVTLNNVQGTNFPYLYAVLVAEKSFKLLDAPLARIEQEVKKNEPKKKKGKKGGLTVESSEEKEVDVIIIRQRTTKTSGYHTKPAAIRNIALAAWHSAELLLKP